jgi:hypothetical protein
MMPTQTIVRTAFHFEIEKTPEIAPTMSQTSTCHPMILKSNRYCAVVEKAELPASSGQIKVKA